MSRMSLFWVLAALFSSVAIPSGQSTPAPTNPKGIVERQKGVSPEVNFTEIHVPDPKDFGTGSIQIEYNPNALKPGQGVMSNMASRPAFQVLVAVNPDGAVMVGIGKADGSVPVDTRAFSMPPKLDPAPVHTLIVDWSKWKVNSAQLDGKPLAETAMPTGAPKKP